MLYTEDALLREVTPFHYQLTFKTVVYRPTADPEVRGTLLFGLRPRGMRIDCQQNPAVFLQRATVQAKVLHFHANGDKWDVKGLRRTTLEGLRAFVAVAVALAFAHSLYVLQQLAAYI